MKEAPITQIPLAKIKEAKIHDDSPAFFTIGYEGRSFEHYLNRLIRNNVRMLCDVRKNPVSRKYGFSKTTLSKALRELGVGYKHVPELGIDSEKRRGLRSQSDYNRLFDDYETSVLKQNEDTLEKIHDLFKQYKRLAITCFEADYGRCHRSRIAVALSRRPGWRFTVQHL